MRRHILPFGVAVVLSLIYWFFAARVAHIEVELDSKDGGVYKIFWTESGRDHNERRSARAEFERGRTGFSLRLADLARFNILRFDPIDRADTWVRLRRVTLRQTGYPDLQLATPADFEQLTPLQGIARVENGEKGLRIVSSTEDAQLEWRLPAREPAGSSWWEEAARIGLIFALVFGLFRAARLAELPAYGYVPYLFGFVFALILAVAVLTKYNAHPDEMVHIRAAEYYQSHWLPAAIGSPEARETYSVYAVSRLHSGEVLYFLAGKFLMLVSPLYQPAHLMLRIFNALLWAGMGLWFLLRPRARIMALPLLVSPQVWYIFSYFNSDAFALFVAMAAAYQVGAPDTLFRRMTGRLGLDGRAVWLLGLLLGLLLLSKQNFYLFVLFVGLYLLWGLRWGGWGPLRAVWRSWAAIIAIGGLIFSAFWALEYSVNGPDREAKLFKERQEFARPEYNPNTPLHQRQVYLQMRERGVALDTVLEQHRWGERSFRSAFGVYGYTSVAATETYYDLVRRLSLAMLALLVASVLVRGGWGGITLMLLTTVSGAAVIGAAFWTAWTADFQAQGRYLLPIVPMLAVLIARVEEALPRRLFQLGVLAMFAVSLYSFLVVGLPGLLARYGI
jgi:hypothetical protein